MEVQTNQAQQKIQQAIQKVRRDMAKETKALAKGLYIAMSNANIKKGKGTPPKPGSKKAENGDWVKGRDLKVHYLTRSGEKWVPVSDWIEKLKQKNFVETYKDKNGKPRRRKVSSYKILPWDQNRDPIKLFENEIWRKGSKENLPYSWGGPGLANYYLRKQWRTTVDEDTATVRISPAQMEGSKNGDKVMTLLDEGGMEKGSKQLIGFFFLFTNLKSGKTGIYATKEYEPQRPMVKTKGYKLKNQVVDRVNNILKKYRPTDLTNQKWRQLGKGE